MPKLLLLSNPMPHYHRIENTLPQLQQALSGIELDHRQDIDLLAGSAVSAYDGVLVYCTGQDLSDAQWAGLDKFIASGKALIGVHNATDTWKNQPGYISLIGGSFISHPPQLQIDVEVVDAEHPITRGLAAFSTWDELYVMDVDPSRYHLLLQTHSLENKPLPLAWTREHGAGRVFYTALGHEPVERADGGPFNPAVHDLLLRGTRWALGGAAV